MPHFLMPSTLQASRRRGLPPACQATAHCLRNHCFASSHWLEGFLLRVMRCISLAQVKTALEGTAKHAYGRPQSGSAHITGLTRLSYTAIFPRMSTLQIYLPFTQWHLIEKEFSRAQHCVGHLQGVRGTWTSWRRS